MEWSFKALGTTWWIEIFADLDDARRTEVKDFCSSFVVAYENNYSRFIADSQLSILNRDRTLPNPTAEFVKLLEYGKQLYLRSDTRFNFLTGHILESKGYDATYSFEDTQSEETAGNPIIDLSITAEQIELRHGNVDLGGYGKGYLIDLLAKEFKNTLKLEQFLINGGGDMYATHQDDAPIEIHLEHPINRGMYITPTKLKNQGFAASSPHMRAWENSTGTHHHIIAKNITADGTYVKAASAADADAFATTVLQLDKLKIEALAQYESLAVAQFDTHTSVLTKTRNFG
jgi:thiamine biosynthesis lipoprotein